MKAVDIMTRPVITSSPDASLEEIASLMLARKIGCVPIVDEHGRLCGIVTESDFSAKERGVPFSTVKLPALFAAWLPKEQAERLFEAARRTPVRDIMTTEVVAIGEQETLEEILKRMLKHSLRRLPVVVDGRPTGIVTRRDLLQLMARRLADT
jgi:CBS domain-containing protein